MTSGGRSVLYYSAFRLPFVPDPAVAETLQQFNGLLRTHLGTAFVEEAQEQLELLNVPEASEAIETLSLIWLRAREKDEKVGVEEFEKEMIANLQLERIWDIRLPSCSRIHKLVEGLIATLASIPDSEYPPLYSSPEPDLQLTPLASLQEQAGKSVSRLDALPGELFTCESLRKWLTRCCDAARSKLLVTREFVTQTADVAMRSDQTLMRLIQPSQRFYKAALDVWVGLGDSATPSKFVEELRRAMGTAWSEALLKPCLFFFKVARNEWETWQEDPSVGFAERVTASLKRSWNVSIVDSCKSLTSKKSSP